MAALARHLFLRGDLERSRELARKAVEALGEAENPSHAQSVAKQLARAGQTALARKTIVGSNDDITRFHEADLAQTLAGAGEAQNAIELALGLLERIEPSDSDIWSQLITTKSVSALVSAGALDKALQNASLIVGPADRVNVLLSLALAYDKAGNRSKVDDVMRQGFEVLIQAPKPMPTEQGRAATVLASLGRIQEARVRLIEALCTAEDLDALFATLGAGARALASINGAAVLQSVLGAVEQAAQWPQKKSVGLSIQPKRPLA